MHTSPPSCANPRSAGQHPVHLPHHRRPKSATLSHRNLLNNGDRVGESLGLTVDDRMVIPVPLYHCFGTVMGNLGCITHASTMIYPMTLSTPN